MTHVVAISDLHGNLPEIPECDLLLIGGDITPVWNHSVLFQQEWLRNKFSNWLNVQPADEIVWVGGNHDFALENNLALGGELPGHYLNNQEITYTPLKDETTSLKIWGSPLSNQFMDWAFMKEEDELAEVYKTIPRDVDIIITHGPPYSYGDRVPDKWARGRDPHVGSKSLAQVLENEDWPNLKLVISGHIHGGYGMRSLKDFAVVNVSHVDEDYAPTHPIVELEL